MLALQQVSKNSPKSLKRFDIFKSPNKPTEKLVSFISRLQICASVEDLWQLHGKFIKTPSAEDVFLTTKLAHRYLCFGNLQEAKKILMGMKKKAPVFLWNETIKSYSRRGFFRESIHLYYTMLADGIRPNEFTFTFVLPACAGARSVSDGWRIHEHAVRRNCEGNAFVATALIDMYGKCGEMASARKVFDKISQRELASFNALIGGCVLNGEYEESLLLFNQMQILGIRWDAMTMVSILQACASLGALQQGRWVHEQILRTNIPINVYLGSALINMYARCGSIEVARMVFDEMPQKDLVCWTSIIAGYGMHGLAEESETLCSRMVGLGIKPDSVAFVGVLAGFSHTGQVEKGLMYFETMSKKYGLELGLEHYSCVVDMLGRAGRLEAAEELVRKMPMRPDAGVWGGLLNACKIHKNALIGERVAEELWRLDPTNAGWYVLMSNIYATVGMWDGVARTRMMMRERNVVKPPGWSSIEVGGWVHRFFVFDRSHPRAAEIYGVLIDLEERMRAEGYVAETSCVLGNMDEKLKVDMLCGHSERLAIAFGILSTGPGEVLRIMKNLRVCVDCHTATKFISRIVKRDIIVRDSNRFHHFKEGTCTCGDYW